MATSSLSAVGGALFLPGNRGRSVRRPVPLEKLEVRVAVRYDDEPQMRHRDIKRERPRLIPAVRSSRRCKGPCRLSIQLTLKPQTSKAVDKCFSSADVFPKSVGVPNTIPSAHSVSGGVGAPYSASILLLRSSQPGTEPSRPEEQNIGHPTEPLFGSGFASPFSHGLSKRLNRAGTRVKTQPEYSLYCWPSTIPRYDDVVVIETLDDANENEGVRSNTITPSNAGR